MQDYLRGEVLEQLHYAWRDAALGAPNEAQRHISEVLDLLDYTITQHSEPAVAVEKARGYLEDAREAVAQSDALGVILALVAALQELEQRPENQ